MQLELTSEQQMLRESARGFARERLLPVAAMLDESGEFPRAEVRAMAEMGFLGVAVPTEYGGAGMDAFAYALAMEEIAAGLR